VATAWKPLRNVRVHLLGLGFRPDVKVDTLSPAYALRDELLSRGALVSLSDPFYSDEELRRAGFEPGLPEAAQVVVLNTAHSEFIRPDFGRWRRSGVQVVLDGRNVWARREAEAVELLYFGIGRTATGEASGTADAAAEDEPVHGEPADRPGAAPSRSSTSSV